MALHILKVLENKGENTYRELLQQTMCIIPLSVLQAMLCRAGGRWGWAGAGPPRCAAGLPALHADRLGTTPHPRHPADGRRPPRLGAAPPARPVSTAVLSACGAQRAPATLPGAGGLLASPGARKCRSRLALCCFPVERRCSVSLTRNR